MVAETEAKAMTAGALFSDLDFQISDFPRD